MIRWTSHQSTGEGRRWWEEVGKEPNNPSADFLVEASNTDVRWLEERVKGMDQVSALKSRVHAGVSS